MVLSDKTIKKLVQEQDLITPFDEKNLSSNSYDLTLADEQEDFELMPGESTLIVTKETVNLPANVAAKTVSKSSFARCGVSVGDIGGWVDAGYKGQLTLLAVNLGDSTFDLRRIKQICQIVFLEADSEAEETYNGHYQNSVGLKEAWFKRVIGKGSIEDRLVDPEYFNKRTDF